MSNEKTAIIDAVTDALGAAVPDAVSSALDALGAKEDDPLLTSVLGIVADFVKANGTEAIEAIGEELQSLVDGTDPMAAYKLKQSGLYLSDLVDALQGAEAERRERASRMTRALSIALADIGNVVVKGVSAALLK